MKLLIVNDEILMAETMKRDIPWENYGIDEVFTAYDANEGKKRLQEQKIDIMLCDIEMPGDNGIELLRWTREYDAEIECIFLTCHASFEYAKEAMTLGCQDYLLVPAKYEDIGATVRKVVNRIRENREAKQYQEYGKRMFREKVEEAAENYGRKLSSGEIVQNTIDYILKNLSNENLNVNEIAEKMYLHPVYLNRLFRKEKEQSVRQFIIEERMKLAAALLKDGKLSVYAISEQVGYQSYSNFYVMFRKFFGCAPGQYQENNKEN